MFSRDLADLHPLCRRRVELWLGDCEAKGYHVIPTCTLRTLNEQTALFRWNRSYAQIEAAYYKLKEWGLQAAAESLMAGPAQPGRQGKKKTNAMPGLSFHNPQMFEAIEGALATDFCIIVHGKADWTDTKAYRKVGILGEQRGLTWSGRWRRFREMCHLQWDRRTGPGARLDILRLARGRYA